MPYPPLLALPGLAEYRAEFERLYCAAPIPTFDSIQVRFKKRDFDHCCFESIRGTKSKSTFSHTRAERLHWIGVALADATSDRRVGWDNTLKRYDASRRVAIVCGNYVTVIAIQSVNAANFITAYVADSGRTIQLIKAGPKFR